MSMFVSFMLLRWAGLVGCSGGGRVNDSHGEALEAAAILRRSDLERAQEHAAHRLGSSEAAGHGDRGDRLAVSSKRRRAASNRTCST